MKVVTVLARFFRIKLKQGKSIIPVRDELEHVRNYLMIHMRYKNKFTYAIEADEMSWNWQAKLMLQPWWKMPSTTVWSSWTGTGNPGQGMAPGG